MLCDVSLQKQMPQPWRILIAKKSCRWEISRALTLMALAAVLGAALGVLGNVWELQFSREITLLGCLLLSLQILLHTFGLLDCGDFGKIGSLVVSPLGGPRLAVLSINIQQLGRFWRMVAFRFGFSFWTTMTKSV